MWGARVGGNFISPQEIRDFVEVDADGFAKGVEEELFIISGIVESPDPMLCKAHDFDFMGDPRSKTAWVILCQANFKSCFIILMFQEHK